MAVSDLVYIDSTGYNYSDYPSFLLYLQTQYENIYGIDVYLGDDSQDGQFLAVLAQALYDVASLGAATYNSFAPPTAQGIGLSRLVKLNGLERLIPTSSTVDLVIVGTNGTVLTNAVAVDSLQQQWNIPTTTIPGSGTITVTATAAAPGAVAALPNTITGIFTPTNGWQSVNNPAAATEGNPVESDGALRIRQAESTAISAQTVFDATIANVSNVVGVTEVVGYENATGSTDGNGLPPHSIALVVEGGDATAIAQAIQVKKTPGTQTDGTTSVTLTDSNGMPITINFYVPTSATISAEVTVVTGTGWNSGTIALIQAAMASAISAYAIGSTIILTQLYASAYLYGTPQAGTFTVVSIELEKNSGGFAASNITLDFNEIPICASTNVTVST
jgi:uncharacterized phage protein gp47/JayE